MNAHPSHAKSIGNLAYEHMPMCCCMEGEQRVLRSKVDITVRCRKLTEVLQPRKLVVQNDSAKHAGHAAMKSVGGSSGETHFKYAVYRLAQLFLFESERI
jgi:hypothetical protein